MKRRRCVTPEEKLSALARLASGEKAGVIAHELGVVRRLLYVWRAAYQRHGQAAFRPVGRPRKVGQAAAKRSADLGPLEAMRAAQEEIAALQRKVGQQQVELDFFRRALRQVRGAHQASAAPGEPTSTRSSKS